MTIATKIPETLVGSSFQRHLLGLGLGLGLRVGLGLSQGKVRGVFLCSLGSYALLNDYFQPDLSH